MNAILLKDCLFEDADGTVAQIDVEALHQTSSSQRLKI